MSIQVEANFAPLQIQRTKQVLRFYNGFRTLPNTLEIKQEGVRIAGNVRNEGWTVASSAPLIVRAYKLKEELELILLNEYELPLVDTRPPWREKKIVMRQ